MADEPFRPRAISLVLAGGIVAALLGPWLGRLGGPLLEPQYVGSFLPLSLVSLPGAGILLGLHMPSAEVDDVDTSNRRLGQRSWHNQTISSRFSEQPQATE